MCAGRVWRYSDSLRTESSGDRIQLLARFSGLFQTGTGAHPGSCTMGIWPIPRVKQQGLALNTHHCNADVKERVQLYIYTAFVPFIPCSRVNFTFVIKYYSFIHYYSALRPV
jgi:hypothetical protein